MYKTQMIQIWDHYTGIENASYYFNAVLNVQGVYLHSNEAKDSYSISTQIYEISNHLKNTEIFVDGRFWMDYYNYNILTYGFTCELFEDGVSSPVDSVTFQRSGYDDSLNFNTVSANDNQGVSEGLMPTAASGTHHVECTLTRLADNYDMHTMVSNDFQIIDETVTGNEELIPIDLASTYFDRTSTGSTSQISFDITVENMYVGTTYNIDWELCFVYGEGCYLYAMVDDHDSQDPSESEGQETFTATSSSQTVTIVFDDPGDLEYVQDPNDPNLGSYTGIENASYYFNAVLNVQGVYLHDNESERFVLGGMVVPQYSQIYEISNHLKNTEIFVDGRFWIDYYNYNILTYGFTCELFEDGVSSPVDSVTFQRRRYDDSLNFNTVSANDNQI